MRTKFKKWAFPYLKEHTDIAFSMFDKNDPFYSAKPLRFEIGPGKGDFLIDQARKNPNFNFIGIERVISVAGPMAKKIYASELLNVRVIYDEFMKVSVNVPNAVTDTIYLNFSDPWPKKKHAKRRLTYRYFLNTYYRMLKKGGKLIIKTDQQPLYEFTKDEINETNYFEIISDTFDYSIVEETDSITEYEAKFRKEGKSIHRIIAVKRS